MTKLLSCASEDHSERVKKLLQGQNIAAKEIKNMRKELAELLAIKLQAEHRMNNAPFMTLHRDDADAPFLSSLATAFTAACSISSETTPVLLLSAGDSSGEGMFLISGPEQFINQHAKGIATLLEGKGGGRKGIFQGKAKNLTNLSCVKAYLETTFQ